MQDPIADMLTRIRNANTVYHDQVDIPGSRLKRNIAELLKDEGFIRDYRWIDNKKQGVLRVFMKYGPNREHVITGLRRISKPSRRVYAKSDELPRVLGGLGMAVVSTSAGILSDARARQEGLGGEVLCYIW